MVSTLTVCRRLSDQNFGYDYIGCAPPEQKVGFYVIIFMNTRGCSKTEPYMIKRSVRCSLIFSLSVGTYTQSIVLLLQSCPRLSILALPLILAWKYDSDGLPASTRHRWKQVYVPTHRRNRCTQCGDPENFMRKYGRSDFSGGCQDRGRRFRCERHCGLVAGSCRRME